MIKNDPEVINWLENGNHSDWVSRPQQGVHTSKFLTLKDDTGAHVSMLYFADYCEYIAAINGLPRNWKVKLLYGEWDEIEEKEERVSAEPPF